MKLVELSSYRVALVLLRLILVLTFNSLYGAILIINMVTSCRITTQISVEQL